MKKLILTFLIVLMCAFTSLSFSQELPKKLIKQDTIGLLIVTNDTIKFISIYDLNKVDSSKPIIFEKQIGTIRIDTTSRYKIYKNEFYDNKKK